MLRPLRTLFRLFVIARILARHDALAALQELGLIPALSWVVARVSRREQPGRPGQKLAAALTEMGPSFIKLGQFLSTRADLLGDQLAADLSELQDHLPPFATTAARATIEEELGRPLNALFSAFEDGPVSAASIAQVHLAVTLPVDEEPSREVAVKVLRPRVEQAFARDLELFYTLAELALRARPKLARFKPVEVVAVFEQTVNLEMDLRMEAAAAAELGENFADDPDYHVPKVDWQRSAQRVLTMERVGGIPLDDREALVAAGHEPERVLTRAAAIFFKQVFRDGFFHGDQHPGNLSVDADGRIVAVDFGIMGRLDRKTRWYLADMLGATVTRDYRRLAEVHVEAGYLPATGEIDTFAQALRSVCEPIFGRPLHQISFARLLGQLFRLTESFDMPVQPQLLLLQKNMLMAEGVSRKLAPELNIWLLAQPLIEDWMRENRGPEARVREGAAEIAQALQRLPETLSLVQRMAQDAAREGLRLHPETAKALAHNRPNSNWQFRALWLAIVVLVTLWLVL